MDRVETINRPVLREMLLRAVGDDPVWLMQTLGEAVDDMAGRLEEGEGIAAARNIARDVARDVARKLNRLATLIEGNGPPTPGTNCENCGGVRGADGVCPRCEYPLSSWRAPLCAKANEAAQLSRRPGAPFLRPTSTRKTVLAWLTWNDPNGRYTDAAIAAEGDDELFTEQDAWEALARVL